MAEFGIKVSLAAIVANGAVHMVKKKHSLWLHTVEDKYPLPNLADLAPRLDGCAVISKLDIRKGYLRVPVAAADVVKTAIITPLSLI